MQKRNSYLIGKAFKGFLTASVLAVAATQVANIISASILGHLVGADGLAAANLSKPVVQIVYALSVFFVGSGSMLVGMAIGNGDRERANRIFTLVITLTCLVGLVVTVLGEVFLEDLAMVLGSTEALLPMTCEYLRVILLASVPLQLSYMLESFVTVDGSPKLVSLSVIVANVVNVPVIFVLVKFFGFGVAGAAWAMFIMYLLDSLLLIPHFMKKGTLRFSLTSLFGKWDAKATISKLVSLGLPLFLSTVLLSIQFMIASNTAKTYLGDGGLVAWAVCLQLFSFSMIILTGTLRTIQPIGSILKGMGDSRGMLLLLRQAYSFMIICLIIYASALILASDTIAMLLGVNDPQYLDVTKAALPAFSFQIAMQALLYVLIPVYQFYDNKLMANVLSVGQALLPPVCFWLMKGNWWGFFVGQVIVAVVLLILSVMKRRNDKSLTPYILVPRTASAEALDISVATTKPLLSEALVQLRTFLQQKGLDGHKQNLTLVCIEEFIKNIIEYGSAHYVDVKVLVDGSNVSVSLHDDGIAFNPTQVIKEDNPEKIGLGLLLIRNFSVDMEYKYIFNQNMVTIRV